MRYRSFLPRGTFFLLWNLIFTLSTLLPAYGQTPAGGNLVQRGKVFASSTWPGYPASGACDGHRYSRGKGHYWCGAKGEPSWGWEIEFPHPETVAKVLLVMGSRENVRRYAPTDYKWVCGDDGRTWKTIGGSEVTGETRLFRILRFDPPQTARFFRMIITATCDAAPALREVEMVAEPGEDLRPDPWFYSVNIDGSGKLPASAADFLPLARRCPGWETVRTQFIQVEDLREESLQAEPRPLCAFVGRSNLDWCQRKPETFRRLEKILKNRSLPLWGSGAGAQLLLILEAHGTQTPWVCPHCEWSRKDRFKEAANPFIYGHIQCRGKPKCGEIPCAWEKGSLEIVQVKPDPVFRYLPTKFQVAQTHYGEIRRLPENWMMIASKAAKGGTVNQLMRVNGRAIYAAQFHVESSGRNGLVLVKNFLDFVGHRAPPAPPGAKPAPPGRGREARGAASAPSRFGGVWWLDTPDVRKGTWNGVVTLYQAGNLVGGYYRNAKGVGSYIGTIQGDGTAEGEVWWETEKERGLWRFRYALAEGGRTLRGGTREEVEDPFSTENGVRMEGGAAFGAPGGLPVPGKLDFHRFGPFTGFWRTESPLVAEGVHDAQLRMKQRGNVVWGYFSNRKNRGFGFLLGVVRGGKELEARAWWRDRGRTTGFPVRFTLSEDTLSFRGRYRKEGGDWQDWNGRSTN
ncbi:MAG: discoidin domain-containing protein [Planctomycetota bacterium]|jgi:hypothetical protein